MDSNRLKNTEQSDDIRHSNSNAEHDSLGAKGIVESEVQPQKTTKRRGRKRKSSTKVTKPSKETAAKPSRVDVTEPVDSSTTIGEKEHEKLIEKSQSKEICSSSYKDPSLEAVQPSESKVENAIQSGSANVVSPSPSGNLRDKSHPRKPGRTKKILIQEPTLPADTASKKHSEGSIDSKVKGHEQSRKRAPGGTLKEDRRPANVDNSKENSTGSDPEIKSLKEVRKAVDTSYITEYGSSKRKKKAKSFGDERASREEDIQKLSVKDDKETFESKDKSAETPETNSKRGRTPGKATAYIKKEIGENLVGKKIKVWWPQDQKFYEGSVESWDPEKKRHRVLYTDGDEEVLYLRTQRWKLVEGDHVSDTEHGTACSNPEEPFQRHRKKKVKMISDSSIKQEKTEATPKSGEPSSYKSKGTAAKPGRKSKNVSIEDVKSKDDVPQSIDESEDGNKTKPINDLFKSEVKSKNVGADTPKTSKGKSLKRSSKPISNGTDKVKSSSSKVVETEDVKVKSLKSGNKTSSDETSKVKPDSSKVKETKDMDVRESPNSSETPSNRKRKTSESSKVQEINKIMTGKKRGRGGGKR